MIFFPAIPSWFMLIPTIVVKLILFLLIVWLLQRIYRYQDQVVQQRQFWILLFFTFTCSMLWSLQYQSLKKKRAFVVKESIYVYAGPEKTFHKIFQLKLGTCLQVLSQRDEMSQVLIDGQCGWVSSDEIKVV